MPLVPGVMPNLRQVAPEAEPLPDAADIIVEMAEGGEDRPEIDMDGNILSIEHPDGSISVSLDGSPLGSTNEGEGETGWFDNLVDDIDDMELSHIAEDLMRGIQDDLTSRSEWVETRAQGLKLLGLKIEMPGLQGTPDGAPVEGMSKVRHPLLLEACLRFQANARSELLPTDGPVKIRNDTNNSTSLDDQLANAYERDFNHYLTSTATEYYPDTDRMLLLLGFGGTSFKKVYFCPLRNRPVSESVDADDLIVNNAATDLMNAKRVTHRLYMKPSTVKRMQILGVYRDTELSTPNAPNLDSVQREKNDQQGVKPESMNPEDRDREIYECYCELDIKGFEHKWKGKVTGLEIPYRVTIDVSSKKILSVVRNYNEDDKQLPTPRKVFVKYTFVPGMGFYDIGLLHILGNTTNAITAAWRELLDAGMFNNFPGFLMADMGARQNTNIFRIPPGGMALVKTGGMPINQAIMPLPYQPPSGALMTLVDNMAQTGERLGGTSEQQVGEGRADAPVGTTLAMIEQAQKILNSVHKRMHAAQAEEFSLLAECFAENPESFWQKNRRPAYPWDEKTFMKAVEDCDLVPHADPNTASHTQRLMKIMALKQLQAANPSMYDANAVDTAALQAIGWSNPTQFMVPQEQMNQMPPEMMQQIALTEAKMKDANSRMMVAQAKMQDTQIKVAEAQQRAEASQAATRQTLAKAQNIEAQTQLDQTKMGLEGGRAQLEMQIKMQEMQIKAQKAEIEAMKLRDETAYSQEDIAAREADRLSKERIQLIDLAQNIAVHPESAPLIEPLVQPALQELANPREGGQ